MNSFIGTGIARLRSMAVALLLAVLYCAGGQASSAEAALTMTYGVQGNTSSSVYYAPGQDGYLHGSNLSLVNVTGTSTPLNNGSVLAITNGSLNFQTGALTSHAGNVYDFGSAGSITLAGGIPGLGVADGSVLLTGSFLSAKVTEFSLGSYLFEVVGASFSGAHNPAIYSYYGVPGGSASFSALSLSFIGLPVSGGGFTSSIINPGVVVDTPVPVPAAAWLLASGLLGLVGIRRRVEK